MKFQRIFKKHNVKQPGKQLILVKHFFFQLTTRKAGNLGPTPTASLYL